MDDAITTCGRCGQLSGAGWIAGRSSELEERTFTCLCDGIVCRYCKRNAIHRPLSDYWDPERGPLRVPFFGNVMSCDECYAKGITGKGKLYRVEGGGGEVPIVFAGDASGPQAWMMGAVVCDQCGWSRSDDDEQCLCAGGVCRVCRTRAIPRSEDVCSECAGVAAASG